MTDSLTVSDELSAAVAKSPDSRVSKLQIEERIEAIIYCTGDAFASADLRGIRPGQGSELSNPWDLDPTGNNDELQGQLAHHTFCLIQFDNGFAVRGHSAPIDPNNFNAELGRRFAYEDAFRQAWPLFAFARAEERFQRQG